MIKTNMAKITRFFYKNFIEPKSKDEDSKRQEFIMNVLLAAIILLFGLSFFVVLYQQAVIGKTPAFSPALFFVISLGFLALNRVSRAGYFTFSAYIFIGMLFILTVYTAWGWGVEASSVLLFFVMIIVMSGILISSRFLLIATAVCSLSVIIIDYLQRINFGRPDLRWKATPIGLSDIFGFILVFLIIAIVTWLSNREIEKTLARARRSEAELKKERDLLEIKVEKRTKELKEAQLEKMAQLSRFAEFGRLSSGLFHDLINPLTAVSLNMEKIKDEQGDGEGMVNVWSYLGKAIEATKKMEEFILAVRKQMSHKENKIYFSLEDEIRQIISILSYRAAKAEVKINFSASSEIKIYGDVVKFDQLAANLITNAIDAYEGINNAVKKEKAIEVSLSLENNTIVFIVKDHGKGIPKENIAKIFDSFFSTKGFYDGIGIGLSLSRNIVEKDFHGTIVVESIEGQGATFIVKIPKKDEHG